MLAYVFWHWPRPGTPAEVYEERQRAFHGALKGSPPAGYHGSFSAAVHGAPWMPGPGYEDWYFVDDFAALGALNDAAVTAARSAPHDAAAALAAGGTAALYGLRAGSLPRDARVAQWFAKPQTMSYAELYALTEPLVRAAGATLWLRQMVLGPSPEFCIQGTRTVALDERFATVELDLARVWP